MITVEMIVWPKKHEETTVLIRFGRVLDYLGRILLLVSLPYPAYIAFLAMLDFFDKAFDYIDEQATLPVAAYFAVSGLFYFLTGRVLRYILAGE